MKVPGSRFGVSLNQHSCTRTLEADE